MLSNRQVAQALEDAEKALQRSDVEQNKLGPHNKEIADLRSSLRALIQAVRIIASK